MNLCIQFFFGIPLKIQLIDDTEIYANKCLHIYLGKIKTSESTDLLRSTVHSHALVGVWTSSGNEGESRI